MGVANRIEGLFIIGSLLMLMAIAAFVVDRQLESKMLILTETEHHIGKRADMRQ